MENLVIFCGRKGCSLSKPTSTILFDHLTATKLGTLNHGRKHPYNNDFIKVKMRYSKPSSILKTLLLASATAAPSQGRSLTDSYTDADTGITFHGYASPPSYLFGMVLPQQPTTDLIVQLVSPLTEGGGWGGVSFGSSMTGPLLLVTW